MNCFGSFSDRKDAHGGEFIRLSRRSESSCEETEKGDVGEVFGMVENCHGTDGVFAPKSVVFPPKSVDGGPVGRLPGVGRGEGSSSFTLDDIPPSKWRERFQEFQAWLSLETQKPQAQTGTILLNFEFMKQSKKLGKVCSRRDLLIKCPSESSCSCKTPKKKTKFKTFKFSKHKGRKIKFLRKKRDFRKKSDRCFVCGKKGHYAKQCPKGKTVKLISHIQQTTGMSLKENDIESIFSTDDEFNSDSLCAFEQWSDSDTPECYQMSTIHTMQPSPVLTVRVLPTKYAKPIKVAGFFDTGASYTIMNPDILPKEYWKKEKQYFHAANGALI
ncbi:hypothetical protein G4B88_030043 [Cannabis sativa]|uniref:CCHC-type domain-containing protein n=1 Tax=Cannabis sativa TaxID=3483 RepID=A0A7J6FVD8_CANSA|nr:hypothetical protein G4B88_030043 [Cannabis sativa]